MTSYVGEIEWIPLWIARCACGRVEHLDFRATPGEVRFYVAELGWRVDRGDGSVTCDRCLKFPSVSGDDSTKSRRVLR